MSTNNLQAVLDRVAARRHTANDVVFLRSILKTGANNTVQLGKYNVVIGDGEDIRIGDQYIYHGLQAENIRDMLRGLRERGPINIGPLGIPRGGLRNSTGGKIIAFGVVTWGASILGFAVFMLTSFAQPDKFHGGPPAGMIASMGAGMLGIVAAVIGLIIRGFERRD